MSVLRHVGIGRDRQGFPGEILEDPVTGGRYIAYTPETYQRRVEAHEQRLAAALESDRQTRRRRVQALHAEESVAAD